MTGKQPSPKQRRFAIEYAIDHNATQAAIRAGYSERSAHVAAARLLKNDKVAAIIEKEEAKHAKRSQMSADQVLAELAKIATSEKISSARVRALELLGKYHGLFVERVQHEGTATGNVVIVLPHNDRDRHGETDFEVRTGEDRA